MGSDFDDLDNDLVDDEDDIAFVEVNQRRKGISLGSSQGSVSSKNPKRKGPMDVFFTPDAKVVVKNRQGEREAN